MEKMTKMDMINELNSELYELNDKCNKIEQTLDSMKNVLFVLEQAVQTTKKCFNMAEEEYCDISDEITNINSLVERYEDEEEEEEAEEAKKKLTKKDKEALLRIAELQTKAFKSILKGEADPGHFEKLDIDKLYRDDYDEDDEDVVIGAYEAAKDSWDEVANDPQPKKININDTCLNCNKLKECYDGIIEFDGPFCG